MASGENMENGTMEREVNSTAKSMTPEKDKLDSTVEGQQQNLHRADRYIGKQMNSASEGLSGTMDAAQEFADDSVTALKRQLDRVSEKIQDNQVLALGAAGVALLLGGLLAQKATRQPTTGERLMRTLHDVVDGASKIGGQVSQSAHDASREAADHTGFAAQYVSDSAITASREARKYAEDAACRIRESVSQVPVGPAVGVISAVLAAGALYALYGNTPAPRRSAASNGGTARRTTRLQDLPYRELYKRARKQDVVGRSGMSKDELIKALRVD